MLADPGDVDKVREFGSLVEPIGRFAPAPFLDRRSLRGRWEHLGQLANCRPAEAHPNLMAQNSRQLLSGRPAADTAKLPYHYDTRQSRFDGGVEGGRQEVMQEAREVDESRRIQDVARTLGLSLETVEGLVPVKLGPPFTDEPPEEQERPSRGTDGGMLIAELRDRISALERRLDDADAERHELLEAAVAERQKLVRLILEREPRRPWPGMWPMLKRLQQRLLRRVA
jgi:hypothetical protein